jgi:hypothetical protein
MGIEVLSDAGFQNGNCSTPPWQFLKECETKRLRGYGTWKNIRKMEDKAESRK